MQSHSGMALPPTGGPSRHATHLLHADALKGSDALGLVLWALVAVAQRASVIPAPRPHLAGRDTAKVWGV